MTDPNLGRVEKNIGIYVRGDPVSDANPYPVTGVAGAPGDATEATLLLILAELQQKLESGEDIDLSPATLAALQAIALLQPSSVSTQVSDITVDGTSGGVTLLASNASRVGAVIQNTGSANMRVTVDGTAPTASKGFRLIPNGSLHLSAPNCPVAAVLAIRESAVNTTAAIEERV